MDPPSHAEYRRVVSREFTPRSTGAMEQQIAAIGVVGAQAPRGVPIDFVNEIAMPIPVRVIADLLGVTDTELDDFRRWSDAMIEVLRTQPHARSDATRRRSSWASCAGPGAPPWARRGALGDDLISLLGATDLTDNEVMMFCVSLLVAGKRARRDI